MHADGTKAHYSQTNPANIALKCGACVGTLWNLSCRCKHLAPADATLLSVQAT
jgi:hypothetical protein